MNDANCVIMYFILTVASHIMIKKKTSNPSTNGID